MGTLIFIPILVIAVGCLFLQYRLFSFDGDGYQLAYLWDWECPNRLTIPFYVGVLLVICGVVYGGIAWSLPSSFGGVSNGHEYLGLVLRCAACCVTLVAKAYFGPTVAGGIVCYSLWGWMEYGEFRIAPILEELLEWFFSATAKPLHFVYLFFVTGFGLASPFIRWKNPLQIAWD